MTKAVFVTATGTDCGKTFISALLVKKMRELGYNCGYFKPVLSGAEVKDGKLIPGDCAYVVKTAGIKDRQPEQCASYIFKTAVSPHLAAVIEGVNIKTKKIKEDFELIKKDYDYLVTEGAGGIICPLNLNPENKILLEDIIKMLDLDVIIVAPALLGTINYTYLTVKYLKSIGIKIRGIILNHYDENNIMCRDNKKQIENLTGIRVIAAAAKGEQDLKIDEKDLFALFKEI